jgi:hypothetical protein
MAPVTRLVKLTPHNLRALLYDLGLGPGSHPAALLYDRYVEMCADVDADPITKNAFGRSLTRQGCTGFIQSSGGRNARHWQIPRSMFVEDPPTELDPESRHPKMGDPDFSAPEAPPLDPDLWEG